MSEIHVEVRAICLCRHSPVVHDSRGFCKQKAGRGVCRCVQYRPRSEPSPNLGRPVVPLVINGANGVTPSPAITVLPGTAATASISFACGLCGFRWTMVLPGVIPLDKYGRIMRAFDVIGCPACRADGFNVTVREEKGVSGANGRDGQT